MEINQEETNKDLSKIMSEIARIHSEISETRKDIESAVTPKFLEISTQVKDLIELSVEIWRLENKLNKIFSGISEAQKEAIENSIKKIKRYLDKNDIEILDHTNHKFNEGRNLDILAVEKDGNIQESIIKETKEPTIMHKGKVIRRGKVIVLEKGENSEEETKDE